MQEEKSQKNIREIVPLDEEDEIHIDVYGIDDSGDVNDVNDVNSVDDADDLNDSPSRDCLSPDIENILRDIALSESDHDHQDSPYPLDSLDSPSAPIPPLLPSPIGPMKVSQMDWRKCKQGRGGIIPVLDYDGVKVYAFGLDNGVASIADFGGHRNHSDENLLHTCIREYHEESFSLFGRLTPESCQDFSVIKNEDTVELLYPLQPRISIPQYIRNVRRLVTGNHLFETQNLVFLTAPQIKIILNSQENRSFSVKPVLMFSRLRSVLESDSSWQQISC